MTPAPAPGRGAAAQGPLPPDPRWIQPAWPVAQNIGALITTRWGGVSVGPWGRGDADPYGGMNLGEGSDDPAAVAANRRHLRRFLPAEPCWLRQVHGVTVVDAQRAGPLPEADAAFATAPELVCCVLVADCLPVLLADAAGRGVAAAHAGWRGLAGGVIQQTVDALRRALHDPRAPVLAYLGPAIGPACFEVGGEVLVAMQQTLPEAARAFTAQGGGKFRADLCALATMALAQVGVTAVYGGGRCTMSEADQFYSYRRAHPTGRQAALIWRKT